MKLNKNLLLIISIGVILTSCKGKDNKLTNIDTIKKDSIITDSNIKFVDTSLTETTRDLNNCLMKIDYLNEAIGQRDLEITNLNITNDSIINLYKVNKEKLAIAEYKLLRIREYNRIAAKGNNIKFLRSWINRTLK